VELTSCASSANPLPPHAAPIPTKTTGEWEGVTASFNADGSPQQLPERFVPDAYREWGVELFDWQSQCSVTTAEDWQLK